MIHKSVERTSIRRSIAIGGLVAWALSIVAGCNFTFGDRVQAFQYDNRTEHAVTITIRYDGEDKEWPGATVVPPHSVVQEHIMIRRKGVQIRDATKSGVRVLDKHYLWDEIPPDQTVTIVIEQSHVTPQQGWVPPSFPNSVALLRQRARRRPRGGGGLERRQQQTGWGASRAVPGG